MHSFCLLLFQLGLCMQQKCFLCRIRYDFIIMLESLPFPVNFPAAKYFSNFGVNSVLTFNNSSKTFPFGTDHRMFLIVIWSFLIRYTQNHMLKKGPNDIV